MDSRYMTPSYIASRESFPAERTIIGQDSRIYIIKNTSGKYHAVLGMRLTRPLMPLSVRGGRE